MAVKPGTKLGPYEILSQIGAGGDPSRDREGAGVSNPSRVRQQAVKSEP